MWIALILVASSLSAQSLGSLEAFDSKVSEVEYAGRKAVRMDAAPNALNGNSFAFVKDVRFHNGTIEVDVAGKPAANAGAAARGFIGLAFRTGNNKYESIYLRPTNGRAPDQVRRNHSTQYHSHPDYDFARLRKESPEKYESYVDLEPGVWTKMRITVEGTKARLYVHGASQPCLIVDDLKLGDIAGGVALWVGPGTEGYFSNLKVTPAAE